MASLRQWPLRVVNIVWRYCYLAGLVNGCKILKCLYLWQVSKKVCQVHFWLQRSDNLYLLPKTVCQGKYVVFQKCLFPRWWDHPSLKFPHTSEPYLNNRVFLSSNYRLIVAPRKFDFLKTNICPRSEASRANMLVLRTSNFQGATIRPIVPRHKHSIVFIVHH